MKTLRERCLTEPLGLARNNFIDAFSEHPHFSMIEDSILDINELSDVNKSMLAATVDELCSKFNVRRPEWVMDPSTYLADPYFSLNAKGDLRVVLLRESPKWYRSRNLFVSNNCSERV